MKDTIGFWGYPDPVIIKKYKTLYPNARFLDLDIEFGVPRVNILPDNYCSIIKNIFDNAFYYKNNLIKILAPVGKDKCDSAFFAVSLLKDFGFDIEICSNETFEPLSAIFGPLNTPISKSNLPLREKIEKITANIIDEKDYSYLTEAKPAFGFWGVPPNDLSVLELFPDNTRVFGWCLCVEAGRPADIELEMQVDPTLPTVFFAQTFCAKNQLAKYLAAKYEGLYIDIDGHATNSVRAKIEAFLRLR